MVIHPSGRAGVPRILLNPVQDFQQDSRFQVMSPHSLLLQVISPQSLLLQVVSLSVFDNWAISPSLAIGRDSPRILLNPVQDFQQDSRFQVVSPQSTSSLLFSSLELSDTKVYEP